MNAKCHQGSVITTCALILCSIPLCLRQTSMDTLLFSVRYSKSYSEVKNSNSDFRLRTKAMKHNSDSDANLTFRQSKLVFNFGESNFAQLRSTENRSKSYERLLETLTEGKFVYCADMFGRKLQIPWNAEQSAQETNFNRNLQRVLKKTVIKANQVWLFFTLCSFEKWGIKTNLPLKYFW